MHRPPNQKKIWKKIAKYHWDRGLVKTIRTQGVPRYIHRSASVLLTGAQGCHNAQTRTQASPAAAESEARLGVGFLVVDISGPAAADSEFVDSVNGQLRRPIRLCSRWMSRWLTTMKLRGAPPVSSHIAKERLTGWCILGSTPELLQSVWVECPKKRRKLRCISYDTTRLFLGCTNPKKNGRDDSSSYSYVLVQQ